MQEKLNQISSTFLKKIQSTQTLKELDEIYLALFGKTGELTLLPRDFASLSVEEKKVIGPLFNQVKTELEQEIEVVRARVREKSYEKLEAESLELSDTEIKSRKGYLHPLTQFEKEIAEIFAKLGFQQYSAPYIDTDQNNFEALNIPKGHPARDLWDTLYIKSEDTDSGKLLLRTHTSNSQTHILKEFKPPFRMMNIGTCFRYENLDARHEHTFDQFEIIYVDKGLSMANLQFLSEQFFHEVLGKDIKVRMRPKYYPFVEPGVGVDAQCIFCKGEGCKICGSGWFELAGAGMIHPNVLKSGGVDPNEYSGIAWGVGPERMMMLKYGIEDIRLFRSGDLKFLQREARTDEG